MELETWGRRGKKKKKSNGDKGEDFPATYGGGGGVGSRFWHCFFCVMLSFTSVCVLSSVNFHVTPLMPLFYGSIPVLNFCSSEPSCFPNPQILLWEYLVQSVVLFLQFYGWFWREYLSAENALIYISSLFFYISFYKCGLLFILIHFVNEVPSLEGTLTYQFYPLPWSFFYGKCHLVVLWWGRILFECEVIQN